MSCAPGGGQPEPSMAQPCSSRGTAGQDSPPRRWIAGPPAEAGQAGAPRCPAPPASWPAGPAAPAAWPGCRGSPRAAAAPPAAPAACPASAPWGRDRAVSPCHPQPLTPPAPPHRSPGLRPCSSPRISACSSRTRCSLLLTASVAATSSSSTDVRLRETQAPGGAELRRCHRQPPPAAQPRSRVLDALDGQLVQLQLPRRQALRLLQQALVKGHGRWHLGAVPAGTQHGSASRPPCAGCGHPQSAGPCPAKGLRLHGAVPVALDEAAVLGVRVDGLDGTGNFLVHGQHVLLHQAADAVVILEDLLPAGTWALGAAGLPCPPAQGPRGWAAPPLPRPCHRGWPAPAPRWLAPSAPASRVVPQGVPVMAAGDGAGKARVAGGRREHHRFSGAMGVPRSGQWDVGRPGLLQDKDHLLLQAVERLVEPGQHPLVVVVVVERGCPHSQHILVVQGVELPEAAHVLLLCLISLLVWGERPWKAPAAPRHRCQRCSASPPAASAGHRRPAGLGQGPGG